MRIFPIIVLATLAGVASAGQDDAAPLTGSALLDSIVKAKWASQEIKPVSRADDAEFLRRAALDITGRIPTPQVAAEFLASKASDKRARLVDQFLASDEYSEYWAEYWTATFLGYDNAPQYELSYYAMVKSMRELVKKTQKLDEFAKALVTVEGKTSENGLGYYWVREQMSSGRDFPMALAGKFSRTFLGMQIACAQCHDHPFDKWTQEDFYGMAGFFSKVTARRVDPQDLKLGYEISDRAFARPPEGAEKGMGLRGAMAGDLTIPGTKEPVKTRFLGTTKGPDKGEDKREAFARLLIARDNVQFPRAAVNRMWGHFFGAGVVDPIDEFTEKNKAWSPELLDKLGTDFVAHGYDLRWLMRSIVLSDTYQLTSKVKKSEREVLKAFAQSRARALSPEQLLHSVVRALGMDAAYGGEVDPKQGRAGLGQKRALLDAVRQFRFNFGDDEGADKTEFQGTIPQALLMMNSEIVSRGLSTKGDSRLAEILKASSNAGDRVIAIFLSVLSRHPSESERAKYVRHASGRGDEGYSDVMWTLLNSSEFLLNH